MKRQATCGLVLGGALVLAACSGDGQDSKPPTQVAVKVNGSELSIHQVNEQMARVANVPAAQQGAARKQVLEDLVDQQLLVQQAAEKKLERDPDVLAALEQSRAQILAQAYLQKSLAAQAKPSVEAVQQYYADNPALFAQRRVFRLQELATDLPLNRAEDLQAAIGSSKSLTEVAAWLKSNNAQVAANSAVRGTEQLPLQQVAAINQMKDGEIRTFIGDSKITVLQVLASQAQPLDEARAAPLIEKYLTNRKRDDLARDELKRLREEAKIEYVGEFATLARADAAVDAQPTAAGPTSGAAPAPAGSSPSVVDKGVTGLR